MSLIRVGVIGCGVMGKCHARVYSELPGVKLVATADVLEEKAREAAREYGAEKWYTDYNDLLARPDIDAVSIVVPDHLHREPTIAAAEAGKAVLLEKPIATTLRDADAIVKAVKKAGITFLVGHIVRFDYNYAKAKEYMDRGLLGEPVSIWARRNNSINSPMRLKAWLKETSLLLFLGVHDIDVMRWIIGRNITRVYAEAGSRVLKPYGVKDAVWSVFRFKGGTIGALENIWILPSTMSFDFKLELVGTRGSIWISQPSDSFLFWGEKGQETLSYYNPVVQGQVKGYLRDEISHFINCVKGVEKPLVSAEDARAAVEVALAIHRSIRQGRPVTLPL
ncbi:MAG: Gfo/Idh/MocA family oxidoreductase [Thaumarchaeota archaeon]|jgi:predicted dehydrogenase|nr:Gfo/Idh/MocA family oxidoreductase [Nitrososphaerota archaeon]